MNSVTDHPMHAAPAPLASSSVSVGRPWLAHYPAGVPADIDWQRYRSCVQLFDEAIAQYRERDAFVCMDKRITYAELDRMAMHCGAWLQLRDCNAGRASR